MTRHEYNHYMRKIKIKNKSAFTPLEIARTNRLQGKKNRLLSLTGFTLLETAIALFVSTLVIVSSLYAFNRAISLINTTRNASVAISYASLFCEETRLAVDADQFDGMERHYELDYDGRLVLNGEFKVDIQEGAVFNRIIPIDVVVSWNDDSNRQRNLTINMLLTQRG